MPETPPSSATTSRSCPHPCMLLPRLARLPRRCPTHLLFTKAPSSPVPAHRAPGGLDKGQQRFAGFASKTSMAPKRKTEADAEANGGKKQAKTEGTVAPDRVRTLNEGEVKKGPVIYWMSRDQRVKGSWALLHACEKAAETGSPVAVAFNLVSSYLNSGARQFGFMLRGLKEMQPKLEALNIPFFVVKGDPVQTIPKLVKDTKAALLVTDFASLRDGRKWRDDVAKKIGSVPFHEVETHNIVPVWIASDKREYGARTIRSKIHKLLPEWFKEIPDATKQAKWSGPSPPKFDWDKEIKRVVEEGKEVPEIEWLKPGEDAAWEALNGKIGFINRMKGFGQLRNDPNANAESNMSPYLHFGQLSAQQMALEISKQKGKLKADVDAFLEEAIVRRELSDNFCFYEPNYDNLDACVAWAKDSLEKHRSDKREYTYTWDQLEKGDTHDDLWNASQKEMKYHGKMSSWNRMYWAKKILEWTESPEQALEYAIKLNDKWEIDGRDSNGYVGCMWSVGGIHDQGWSEREVFGKIRYMNYNGAKRKFDVPKYVKRIDEMVAKVKKNHPGE